MRDDLRELSSESSCGEIFPERNQDIENKSSENEIAGFWDRGLGDYGTEMSDLCKPHGEAHIFVGDPADPETWTYEGG